MFQTRWRYPICAIIKAIELDHSIIWYVVETNLVYMSKFEWEDNKVIEKTLNIEDDDFDAWYDKNIYNESSFNIHKADDSVWYYDYESRKDWMTWECDDLIKRYKNCYPASDYRKWFDKKKR